MLVVLKILKTKVKPLTSKQEAFSQAVASGKSQADAYRAAFDCTKSTPESVQTLASRLMAKVEVRSRVVELKEQLSEKGLWTREMSVRALTEACDVAKGNDNVAGVVAAVRELNNMHGFNEPQKVEHTGNVQHSVKIEFVDAEVSD
jgi:phage terminase small subunit